tara:strand:- start:10804 stop:11652 length:849 start_codon:yes stop_codon:yes gene_type:complete
MNQKKYFITYGSKDYSLQKKHLINLVKKSEYFDEYVSYGPKDLSKEFKQKYHEILKADRGGGYWIWKHEIILNLLDEINYGDCIVYSSAGSSFNINGKPRLDEYFEIINSSEKGNLRFQIPNHIEKDWTTKEIFEYFNIEDTSSIRESEQLIANHFILKKNENSIEIFNEFRKLVEVNKDLITHKYDDKNQIASFNENRNDQSILSILSKIYGAEIIEKDETFFKPFDESQYTFPFLAVRKRKYSFYQKLKFYFRYKKNINKPIYFGTNPTLLKRIIYKIKT